MHQNQEGENSQLVKKSFLLKMFQTYDKKQFANVVPGDENRVY